MGNKLYKEETLQAIADAIRTKNGLTLKYKPGEMAAAILAIKTAPTLQSISVDPTESQQTKTPPAGVDGYNSVTVTAIPANYIGSEIERKTSADMTASGATVTAPAGYYSAQAQKSIPGGAVTLNEPTVNSAGLVTASANVTAGYVSQAPGNKTKQLTTKAAQTITPTKSEQTLVNAGVYTTGVQKVAAIPAEYIIPSGSQTVTENKTVDVTNLKELVVNVPQSGGGMNIQAYFGVNSVSATAYTATNTKLTVAKTGTYKVSWMGWRSTNSGTSGSQLYINGSAYGSANTTFTNTYGHRVELNNVQLTAGQEIVVRARARSTSYVMAVGNLIIEQTA